MDMRGKRTRPATSKRATFTGCMDDDVPTNIRKIRARVAGETVMAGQKFGAAPHSCAPGFHGGSPTRLLVQALF